MTRHLRPVLLAVLALAVAACDSGGPDDAGRALYVGNAGNFSDNNGSLTRYVLETGETAQDAVPGLGGLVQGLVSTGDELFVLLNFGDSFSTGRGRIDVVGRAGGRLRQIDVRTPRGLGGGPTLTDAGGSAYVSNLYDDTVTPVDLATGTAGTPIPVGRRPEGVVAVAGRVYVGNADFGKGTTVSVVQGGAITETLADVCAGPRTLLADRQQEVWIVCTGRSDFQTGAVTAPGQVVVLDGATGAVRQRFTVEGETLGSFTFGQDGFVTADGREVFVVADGAVLRFDADDNRLVARIEVPGAPVGAVAYDAEAGRLYVGRADADNPYTVDGVVTVHDLGGAEVGRFRAGIAPAALAFAAFDRAES